MTTRADTHTTLGSLTVLMADALRERGLAPEPVFARAGIDPADAFGADKRVPSVKIQTLFSAALEATGDPCFGLCVAEQMRPAALHGLGLGFLVSETLRDGLARVARFSRLLSTAVQYELQERQGSIDVVLRGPERLPGYVDATGDAGVGIILQLCRITAQRELALRRVTLRRSAPPCPERMAAFFGVTPQYGAAENRLCFHPTPIMADLPLAHPELARVNDQAVVDYLSRFDRQDFLREVRERIIESLPSGPPRADSVARSLNLGMSTFLRRLRDKDVQFKALVGEVRRELARDYVRNSNRSFTEITFLLGFSDPSNFTRAFRRWYGVPPARLRTDRHPGERV